MENFPSPLIFVGDGEAPSPTNNIISHSVSTLKRFVNKDVGQNIFQRSFHDHIIRGEEDYLKIWNYIDTNPAKWSADYFFYELAAVIYITNQ